MYKHSIFRERSNAVREMIVELARPPSLHITRNKIHASSSQVSTKFLECFTFRSLLSLSLSLGSFTVILAAFRFLSKNRLVTIALQNCACLIVYFFNVPLPDTSLSSAVNITFPKSISIVISMFAQSFIHLAIYL